MDSPIQAGHGSRDFGGFLMFPDLPIWELSPKYELIWKYMKIWTSQASHWSCLKEQNLASTSSVKLQECFELLAETVQVVFGGPELLSLYVPTSMHHMRYKQRKIRENLVFWDIHLKQIPAGQIQSHLVNCNLEEPWFILEASIIIGMYFLYAPLGVV